MTALSPASGSPATPPTHAHPPTPLLVLPPPHSIACSQEESPITSSSGGEARGGSSHPPSLPVSPFVSPLDLGVLAWLAREGPSIMQAPKPACRHRSMWPWSPEGVDRGHGASWGCVRSRHSRPTRGGARLDPCGCASVAPLGRVATALWLVLEPSPAVVCHLVLTLRSLAHPPASPAGCGARGVL